MNRGCDYYKSKLDVPAQWEFGTRKMESCIKRTGKPFWILIFIWITTWNSHFHYCNGCEFFPLGEYLRFVRIPENFPMGERLLTLKIQNKGNLTLESVDKGDDAKYFGLVHRQDGMVDIQLVQSLEQAVSNDKNILKFRLSCFPGDTDMAPNFLSISVFIEDVNNHHPKFVNTPYAFVVDELTPTGITIFRGISAVDYDKPNTPNSEIKYSIVAGNEKGKFGLESGQVPGIVLRSSLDYDTGDREFRIVIEAMDRGSPPLSANATVFITVKDNDDLPVTFEEPMYTTAVEEFYPITNKSIRQELHFDVRIHAYDQDVSINSPVIYDIVSGNEFGFFDMDPNTAKIYLTTQLDRELLQDDLIELTIRARQINSYSKFGTAKVIVEILDLNDNLPEFEHMAYNISIMENLPNGFSVLQIYAKDADKNENAAFLYKLEDTRNAFTIDAKTGWLTVLDEKKLDREELDSIELKISTVEMTPNVANGGKRQNAPATVTIGLLDANDNSPTFTPSNLFHFEVTVDAEVGSVVGQVTAKDADVEADGNGKVLYEFQKSNKSAIEELPFELDSKHGYIFLLERPLPKAHYTLLIEAYDQPSNPSERRHSLAVVQIDVVKASNRHAPEFVGSPYEFWVGTTVGIGTSVGQVKVKDLEPKHTVYDLLHSYYEGVPFAIEERTGIIAVVDELQKFSRHHYDFEAYVTDSRHTLTTNVSIHIVDPVQIVTAAGTTEPIQLNVKENEAGSILANLKKLLSGNRNEFKGTEFLLTNFEVRDKFTISNDGTIYTLKKLDREEKSDYILTVIAQNRGLIQGQGIYQVIVKVEDENDNPPRFDRNSYEGHVRENSPPGTPVTLKNPVKVNDKDEGVNALFQIELKGDGADRFRVDPSSGKIYVGNIPLDREEKSSYALELLAIDSGNLSSRVPLRIAIDDVNDNAPIFERNLLIDPPDLDRNQETRDLMESSSTLPISIEISTMQAIRIPETIDVGSKIARVVAFDRDAAENSIVFYTIAVEKSCEIGSKCSNPEISDTFSGNRESHFNIDRTAGEISVTKPLRPNYEYALNISASDRGGLRTHNEIKVHVYDVNNFQPIFEQSGYVFEILEGSVGVAGRVIAHDRDLGPNGRISYSLKSKYEQEEIPFVINATTGEIVITGDLDREMRDKYFLTAVATDAGNPALEGSVDVQLEILDTNDNKPVFYGFSTNVNDLPVYVANVSETVSPGTVVATVFANDSDSTSNGYGLVLLHLRNHHREFYLDSKNGSIVTASNLDYDTAQQYNLTVIASDHGKPSQSSSALVIVTVHKSPSRNRSELAPISKRLFSQLVYAYQVPSRPQLPFLITIMNVTEHFRTTPTTYEIVGDKATISKFRIDPTSGAILLIEAIDDNRVYEFIVRATNAKNRRNFETKQIQSDISLGPNEALLRVRRVPSRPVPIQKLPSQIITTSTHEPTAEAAEPAIITKAPPRSRLPHGGSTMGQGGSSQRWPTQTYYPNVTTVITAFDADEEQQQRNSNYYAGEVAVLTLSAVIFLGGLVAAIAVACVRKRRRHSRRINRHIPILPPDVRLQKQIPRSARIAKGPIRPILFPMALPPEPLAVQHEESNGSDHTSDTYTDAVEVIGHTHTHIHRGASQALQKAGYSICPDCRKLKKPIFVKKCGRSDEGWRDVGPMKQIRHCGFREMPLQSSHDSGIDGSDGQQCSCFRNHRNSSSTISEQQFEDSLTPEEARSSVRNRSQESLQQQQRSVVFGKNNLNYSHRHISTGATKSGEGVVIL